MTITAYNKAFFASQVEGSARSAAVIVPRILKLFPKVKSVVDVGCGTGVWLRHFQLCGVDRILGIDGGDPSDLLQIERDNFISADLRRNFPLQQKFDLAICLEVAEHLPAESAELFISELCRLSDRVIFSAAIPGQGGTAHLNERWPSYWSSLFSQKGFACLDVIRPSIWFDERVEWWYAQNILVFAKRGSEADLEEVQAGKNLDLVHPRCFAQYRLHEEADELENPSTLIGKALNISKKAIGIEIDSTETRYLPSTPVAADTKYLFVEFPVLHEFLFDTYGQLENSQLLLVRAANWWIGDREYNYIRRSTHAMLDEIFFLTLERLLYDPDVKKFVRFTQSANVPVSGILHRLPENEIQIRALKKTKSHIKSIVVLSEEMVGEVQRLIGDEPRVQYLPHHAPNQLYYQSRRDIRPQIGARADDVVISLLGEIRDGKGVDLLLDALQHLSKEAKRRLFFLFAGRQTTWSREQVEAKLHQNGCRGFVDIRPGATPNDFRVMSNQELVDYTCASNVGLLLYQGAQRHCASGVLPGYVCARKIILATKDSMVGREVVQYQLGDTLDDESPAALALQFKKYSESALSWKPSDRYVRFRENISSESIIAKLRDILSVQRPK